MDCKSLDKFDVVMIDPPWPEYRQRVGNYPNLLKQEKLENWSLEEIRHLKIDQLTASPSFVFLWVGSEHLDQGRSLFKKWGFKRCEDIVWLKSNINKVEYMPEHTDANSLLKKTKEPVEDLLVSNGRYVSFTWEHLVAP